ncbi:cytochrome P450 [Mariniluteicoccus flavus]
MPQRRAVRPGEPDGADAPRVERVGKVWRVRSLQAARDVLRARTLTTQAGFTAEHIPKGALKHHPILMSDGPLHDEQRSKVGRFFAPKVVAERYTGLMEECADRLLAKASATSGTVDLDELALHFAVEVTAEVVGLTESPVEAMSRRLVTFFNQPPFDITRPDLGRTPRQWASAAINGLVPIARFFVADVRPAIRSRRRRRREDVISHLLDEGYTTADILVECVTYGTAGMVTTREFICMAAWHLLTDDCLRSRFLAAGETERHALLNEIIRLEPVVGHLYRRAQGPVEFTDGDRTFTAEKGDLIDVCVRPANADPQAVGEDALTLCPGRTLPRGVNEAGLAFGDGAHRCPGQPLAILETDVLLTRLLKANPTIVAEPELGWDDLIAGYWLRGFTLRLG